MSKLEQVLQQYQKKNIAVYGLGSETERLLDKLGTQYHIAGCWTASAKKVNFTANRLLL